MIIDGARVFDLDLDRSHTDLFAAHAGELLHWTKTTNLTTITDPYEVAIKHFVDSLVPAGQISPGAALLDIGSGGGFPGIPLKVVMPSLEVILIDASRKKANFLKHVIRTLKLEGIQALHIRAEDLKADPAYTKRFDFILSRALTDLASFVGQAWPLLAEDGLIMALKGQVDQKQIDYLNASLLKKRATGRTGSPLNLLSPQRYDLPVLGSKRSIICLKKTSAAVSVPGRQI